MAGLRAVVRQSIDRLDGWLVNNGWAGYDPYDLPGLPAFIRPAGLPAQTLRRAALKAGYYFPRALRRLFGVPRMINAKGMGLFAEGYRLLYEVMNEERYLRRAQEALAWLEANAAVGYAGPCWGYPFDWQSRVLIPRGTPSSVVSATVGHAFWGFYQMTGEQHYLDVCRRICEFFLHDLRIDRFDDGHICFSYTPIDTFHVHNANLFVADFLVRVGLAAREDRYVDHGMQAVAYTLGQQNDDGSICYWGRDQESSCNIDHYHSGFEIRCLHGVWKGTADARVYRALQAYYAFYRERLFQGHVPKMTPARLYPVDVHSCAEAILCHSTLAPDFPAAWDDLWSTVPWILREMQHREGWFIYRIARLPGGVRCSIRIPYIRWGQAWMLRSLATLYRNMESADEAALHP
ncbi:MAG: hypothetical protein JW900_14005 [Anaerolineae bacterium]|nr:hypothetical protein [Anaerolineae bacterium]